MISFLRNSTRSIPEGMGHGTGSKLAGLFRRLKQDPVTWKGLTTL
jgi:hypothetical protein